MANLLGAIGTGATVAITIKGIDQFSKTFKQATTSTQKVGAALKVVGAMAVAATAAIVGFGISSVKEASKAEGSWNKFNTVFAEGSDEMRAFVEDLRKEMPSATHEIARMGADLQDLLIPMGLARDEAQGLTMQALDLANKLAAFNDASPVAVLEAMKSGFTGQSQPLRQFGIDARITSLEAVALKNNLMGTAESFAELDPAIRMAVQSQALMIQMTNQSADAISGFEDNQDSLIRRTQEMQAVFGDLKVELGTTLIPIVTELADVFLKDVLPAVKPVIQSMGEFLVHALEKLSPYLPRLADYTIQVVDVFLELLDSVLPLIDPFFELIDAIFPSLIDLIRGLMPVIKPLIRILTPFLQILAPIVEFLAKVISGAARIGGAILGGSLNSIINTFSGNKRNQGATISGRSHNINDAIINPSGKIITTNPNDYLIATQNPQSLGNTGITIYIDTVQGIDAEDISDALARRLSLEIKR